MSEFDTFHDQKGSKKSSFCDCLMLYHRIQPVHQPCLFQELPSKVLGNIPIIFPSQDKRMSSLETQTNDTLEGNLFFPPEHLNSTNLPPTEGNPAGSVVVSMEGVQWLEDLLRKENPCVPPPASEVTNWAPFLPHLPVPEADNSPVLQKLAEISRSITMFWMELDSFKTDMKKVFTTIDFKKSRKKRTLVNRCSFVNSNGKACCGYQSKKRGSDMCYAHFILNNCPSSSQKKKKVMEIFFPKLKNRDTVRSKVAARPYVRKTQTASNKTEGPSLLT